MKLSPIEIRSLQSAQQFAGSVAFCCLGDEERVNSWLAELPDPYTYLEEPGDLTGMKLWLLAVVMACKEELERP